MNHYQISEEDVDGVVRYMKIFHPENANRDYCRGFLEYFKSGLISSLRKLALDKPDEIEAMYEKYEAHLKDKDLR